MKFYNNKYEYVLILIANAALFLCIALATHNCKENNTVYKSMFHNNNIEKNMKGEQSQFNGTQPENKMIEIQPDQQAKRNLISYKNHQNKNSLYTNFSIYSFFNY